MKNQRFSPLLALALLCAVTGGQAVAQSPLLPQDSLPVTDNARPQDARSPSASERQPDADLPLDKGIALERNFRSGYYFYNRRNYTASISFFDQSISVNPYDYRSRIWLGQSYYMAGFLKNAYTEWQAALNLGAGGNLLRNRLQTLYAIDARETAYASATPYIFLRAYDGYREKKAHFVRPSGMAIDDHRNLYVAGFANGKVSIVDPNGNIVNELSAGLSKPYDVAFAPDGSFYVSDFGNDNIVRYARDGRKLAIIGRLGFRLSELVGPEGICVDRAGNLFVADCGNNRVQKFSPQGKFLMTFGKKGRGEGEFFRPSAVLALPDGRILVSDCGNGRLQLFDESGNFLRVLGRRQLSSPRGLELLTDGRIAVADERRGVVVHDMKDGSWNRLETLSGRVDSAVGLAVDRNNLLYVTDFDSYRVSAFIPEHLKYVNLDVRLVRTLEFEFPQVQHTVIVRDREGRIITGLTAENFRVNERGVDVRPVSLQPTVRNKDKLSAIFVIDKSLAMEPYAARLERVMRGILERLPATDTVEVINAGEKSWISQRWIGNVLSPLAGARQGEFARRPAIGRALYQAVSESFANDYRQVIVLMTAASFRGPDWKPYGFDTCLQYARNNGIPVHVVYFGQGGAATQLDLLASETGGRTYDALRSNEVYRIRENVMASPLPFYSLLYETVAHPKLQNTYRDFTIEVQYNGLFGYDSSGYYIPKL